MRKYTYDDINIIGGNERVSNAFGKECYYGYNVQEVLDNALNDRCKFILRQVDMDNPEPFGDTSNRWYPFMIVKKEESKPEYVSFTNQEEFLSYYAWYKDSLAKSSSAHCLSKLEGVWLKRKYSNTLYMVTEIWDRGVTIGNINLRTTGNEDNEDYFTTNDVTKWCELYENYTFPDGTPCGSLKGTAICNIEDSKAATTVSSKSV